MLPDDEIARAVRYELAEHPARAIAAFVGIVLGVFAGWIAYCVVVTALADWMGLPR